MLRCKLYYLPLVLHHQCKCLHNEKNGFDLADSLKASWEALDMCMEYQCYVYMIYDIYIWYMISSVM